MRRSSRSLATLLPLLVALPALAADGGAKAPAPAPLRMPEHKTARQAVEVSVAPAVRKAVLGNPLVQRLSTISGRMRFTGGAQGAWRWRHDVMGKEGQDMPLLVPTPRGRLNLYASPEGARLWIAGAQVRDEGAVLRLGDLLPLLAAIGIDDREAALAVRQVSINGGGAPPSYTLSFATGTTWKHRAALAAAEKAGKAIFSHTTGRVTVLGAFVMVDAKGELSVRPTSREGEQLEWLRTVMVPRGCRDLEKALRGPKPASALAAAEAALARPSISQACAARYLAAAGVPDAAGRLRRALEKNRVAWPAELVEALATVDPKPDEANLKALAGFVKRDGAAAADGVCKGAPLTWLDRLLEREDLRGDARAVLRKCAWR